MAKKKTTKARCERCNQQHPADRLPVHRAGALCYTAMVRRKLKASGLVRFDERIQDWRRILWLAEYTPTEPLTFANRFMVGTSLWVSPWFLRLMKMGNSIGAGIDFLAFAIATTSGPLGEVIVPMLTMGAEIAAWGRLKTEWALLTKKEQMWFKRPRKRDRKRTPIPSNWAWGNDAFGVFQRAQKRAMEEAACG